jgi:monoamine oxidase
MRDAVVIGGGFAGAVAFRELAASGADVLMLEARDRLGGRGYLKKDALPGIDLELGCQFFQTRYAHVYGEITRYGVPFHVFAAGLDADHWLLPDGTLRRGGMPVSQGSLPFIEDLVFELRTLAARIDMTRPWAEQFPGEEGARWDISVDAWMELIGTPPEIRDVFQCAISPWLVTPREGRSLLYLARMVAADGGLARYLVGENVTLDRGTTDLADRIAADAKAPIHLRSPVRRIAQNGDVVSVYTDDGEIEGRVVVCAVPVAVLADIVFEPGLERLRLEASEARRGGEGTKVWSVVRNVPDAFLAVSAEGGLHTIVHVEQLAEGALVLSFGPSQPWIDGSDVELVQRELRRFFPDAEVVASMGHDWLEDPWTRNSNPFPRPGDVTRHQAVLATPHGRVVFAGSETSFVRPGFVDGAIETGFRAARDARAILDGGVPLHREPREVGG